MNLDPTEPAIDMLYEIQILRDILKMQITDKIINYRHLNMLSLKHKVDFLMQTDEQIINIVADIQHANDLLDEFLDYFMPTNKLLEAIHI